MSGFEVTFNGKTTSVAVSEHLCMSIIIEKIGSSLRYSFSGQDKYLSYVWDFAEELKLGDEFIIRKKGINKSSDPIHTQPVAPPFSSKEEALRVLLERYRELEATLKGKGLI
jgi:hypothetical protein